MTKHFNSELVLLDVCSSLWVETVLSIQKLFLCKIPFFYQVISILLTSESWFLTSAFRLIRSINRSKISLRYIQFFQFTQYNYSLYIRVLILNECFPFDQTCFSFLTVFFSLKCIRPFFLIKRILLNQSLEFKHIFSVWSKTSIYSKLCFVGRSSLLNFAWNYSLKKVLDFRYPKTGVVFWQFVCMHLEKYRVLQCVTSAIWDDCQSCRENG